MMVIRIRHGGRERSSWWRVGCSRANRSWAPGGSRERLHRLAEVLGGGEFARAGEDGEHARFGVAEQEFGGQFGDFAPEAEHQLDAPGHDHLDGGGALEALGCAVLEFLDPAAGLEDAEVILDAPAKGVPLQQTGRLVDVGHRQGGEQEPLQRVGVGRRALLAGVHHPQHDRLVPGARQRDPFVAQVSSACCARRLGLRRCLLAFARALCRIDGAAAAGRGTSHLVEQVPDDPVALGVGLLGEDAVGLRAHQQVDRRSVSRCWTNRWSRKSASRSMTHTGRVWGRWLATSAQSCSPSIQRNDFFCSRALGPGVSGGTEKSARSTPSGVPSGSSARVACSCQVVRPRAGLVRADRCQPRGGVHRAPIWGFGLRAGPDRRNGLGSLGVRIPLSSGGPPETAGVLPGNEQDSESGIATPYVPATEKETEGHDREGPEHAP